MNITPCYTSGRSAQLSSHSSLRPAPLIPALMNQTRLSRRSSRAGETLSASASEFLTRPASLPFLLSPPHISLKCDSWGCFLCHGANWFQYPAKRKTPLLWCLVVRFGDGQDRISPWFFFLFLNCWGVRDKDKCMMVICGSMRTCVFGGNRLMLIYRVVFPY